MTLKPAQQYTCRSCKNAECPVWIGSNLQEAQSGRLRDTHPILAVIMTVGCTYHSAFRPHPAPAVYPLQSDYNETELVRQITDAFDRGYAAAQQHQPPASRDALTQLEIIIDEEIGVMEDACVDMVNLGTINATMHKIEALRAVLEQIKQLREQSQQEGRR